MNVWPKQTAIHISIIITEVDAVKLHDLYIDLVVMVNYNGRAWAWAVMQISVPLWKQSPQTIIGRSTVIGPPWLNYVPLYEVKKCSKTRSMALVSTTNWENHIAIKRTPRVFCSLTSRIEISRDLYDQMTMKMSTSTFLVVLVLCSTVRAKGPNMVIMLMDDASRFWRNCGSD